MSILKKLFGAADVSTDPVCGMKLPATRMRAWTVYGGQQHHFCSEVCKKEFERDPDKFMAAPAVEQKG
jgi:YHS domain-containing protein